MSAGAGLDGDSPDSTSRDHKSGATGQPFGARRALQDGQYFGARANG